MKIMVEGNNKIYGEVNISGSKNSALPIIVASILNKGITSLYNVPDIKDIKDLLKLIELYNVRYIMKNNKIIIDSTEIKKPRYLTDEYKNFRASYYLMSLNLYLFNESLIIKPGGCILGERPIDLHLYAFNCFGYINKEEYLILEKNIDNISIKFRIISVGATINALILSMKYYNVIIKNSAIEPEVLDLIEFLKKLGRRIIIKKRTIISKRKNKLNNNINHFIIPDRIEALTYLTIGGLCGGIKVKGVNILHLKSSIKVLKKLNVGLIINDDNIYCYKKRIKSIKLKACEYPGFPTDGTSIIIPLLIKGNKVSKIKDNIYNRFKICDELNKMNCNIIYKNNKAIIYPSNIKYGNVKAYDLRCSAGLLISCLIAKGISIIDDIDYLFRGYDNIIEKLNHMGGKILLIKD